MFPAGQVENFRSAFQYILAKITPKCGKFAFGDRAKVLIPKFFRFCPIFILSHLKLDEL